MYSVQIEIIWGLSVILQGYLLSRLMSSFMQTKLQSRRGSRFYVVLFWFSLKLIRNLWVNGNYDYMVSMLKQVLTCILLFLFVAGVYQGRKIFQFYLTIIFMAFSEISFFLSYMIIVLGKNLFDLYTWYLDRGYLLGGSEMGFLEIMNATAFTLQMLVYIVSLLLLFFFIRAFLKKYRERDFAVQKTEMLFLLLPGMTGFLICILLRMIIVTMEKGIPVLLYDRYPLLAVVVPMILLLALLAVFFSVQILQDMVSLNREKNSRIIMDQQVRSIQIYIQEMNRAYAGVRSMRHDMKNQLSVMYELLHRIRQGDGEEQELEAHLKTLEKTADSLEPEFRTGNVVVDAILHLKCHEAKEKMPDIKLDVEQLIFPTDLKIRNHDITVILCNALDNAIEACEKLDEEKERKIRLSSFQKGKLFFLRIENSFNGQLMRKERLEFPATDKQDRGFHGIGFLNMKAAAQRYCGAVDWEAEDGMFYLRIMMKNETGEHVE